MTGYYSGSSLSREDQIEAATTIEFEHLENKVRRLFHHFKRSMMDAVNQGNIVEVLKTCRQILTHSYTYLNLYADAEPFHDAIHTLFTAGTSAVPDLVRAAFTYINALIHGYVKAEIQSRFDYCKENNLPPIVHLSSQSPKRLPVKTLTPESNLEEDIIWHSIEIGLPTRISLRAFKN